MQVTEFVFFGYSFLSSVSSVDELSFEMYSFNTSSTSRTSIDIQDHTSNTNQVSISIVGDYDLLDWNLIEENQFLSNINTLKASFHRIWWGNTLRIDFLYQSINISKSKKNFTLKIINFSFPDIKRNPTSLSRLEEF